MKMFYRQPAAKWVEGLPQGNGRLGIMAFGGIARERIGLNEDTLWSGHPGNHIIPGSYEHIQKAQELVLAGKAWEAEEELRAHVLGEFTENYEPLGDLLLTFPNLEQAGVTGYLRELSLMDGVARTAFTVEDVVYERTTFVSHPQQMTCLRMTASQPVLTAELALDSQLRHQIKASGCEIVMSTRCPSRSLPSYHDTSPEAISYDDAPERQGISATTILRVATDGRMQAAGKTITVSAATWLELRLVCRSNFEAFDKYPGLSGVDHVALARKDLDAAETLTFADMLAAHRQDFIALMARQSITVGGECHDDLPTDVRLRRYSDGAEDDSLPILLYQFGRYLLVSGSRPGTQALNLQGIWNDMMQPPWSSNYTTNINTEMNYWPAEICNVPGAHEPLFDLVDRLSVTGGEVAREVFHARGAVTNHNTDLWGLATPVGLHGQGAAVYGWWPMAYGWLSGHLFEHYIYTGDKAFLRERALPVLRSAAQFFIDTVSADKNGYLTMRPATSPEHKYVLGGQRISVASATTMTDEIIREVLRDYLTALDHLGLEEPDADAARHVLAHTPPYRIGPDGRLVEWDAAYEETEPQHRHLSLLSGLFPGHLITADSEPRILDAVRATLAYRGDGGTGWSLGWKVNIWARLRDGDHALKLLRGQLHFVDTCETEMHNSGGSYMNLFSAHPPFQIDGNFAAASGVPRLLVDSALDELTILPALPSAWRNVEAQGLRGANGYTVDLKVENGKLTYLKLISGSDRPTILRLFDKRLTVSMPAGNEMLDPVELMK